jgi:hypothetical protein
MKLWIDVFGWYGMSAIVLAYALVSFSVLSSESLWFQLLNASGALGLVAVSFSKKAYQPGVLNIIWTTIAIVAIIRIVFSS